MATERLSHTFAALADPTRRAILARLSSGAATVTELAKPFDMSMPAISKHIKVLEHAGLIARGREAQWRPCHLDAAPLKEIAEWLGQYRQFWDKGADSVEAHLRQLRAPEMTPGRKRRRRGLPQP